MTIEELQRMRAEGFTRSILLDLFANTTDKPADFKANFKFKLDKDILKEANSPILLLKGIDDVKETTVGRFVVNLFLFDYEMENGKNLASLMSYYNEPIDSGKLGKINSIIADYYFQGYISDVVIRTYLDKIQWFGYGQANYLHPSLDYKTLVLSKELRNYKDKVVKDNLDIINNMEALKFGSDIENPVLKFAKEDLKKNGAIGTIIYDSGWNGNFNNNFKNTSLFRGVVPRSDDQSKYTISLSNLVDGVKKEDLETYFDIAIAASKSRAFDTRKGGYMTKIFNAAFASCVLDVEGSNCGTKHTTTLVLPEGGFNDFQYRYIVDRNKLVLLDRENYTKYAGKEVNMRTPVFCATPKYCEVCAGKMFHKLKIKNIGLVASVISSAIMYKSMKAFHDMSLKAVDVNIMDYIQESSDTNIE